MVDDPKRWRSPFTQVETRRLWAARHTAMALVAAWYHSLDGGHAVFSANDSAPNLDYLRAMEAAGGTLADGGVGVPVTKNPRQEVQHAHLHAFYAERDQTENQRLHAAQRATAEQRASFETFAARHGLNAHSLDMVPPARFSLD